MTNKYIWHIRYLTREPEGECRSPVPAKANKFFVCTHIITAFRKVSEWVKRAVFALRNVVYSLYGAIVLQGG